MFWNFLARYVQASRLLIGLLASACSGSVLAQKRFSLELDDAPYSSALRQDIRATIEAHQCEVHQGLQKTVTERSINTAKSGYLWKK